MKNIDLTQKASLLLRKFDLNLLLVFEALITECHVTRAAKKLCLSQPAVSHSLNKIRNELDDPLLIKTDKGMRPTPRARAMLPQVQQILKLIENTLIPPEGFNPSITKRKFVLAVTDYFELMIYPQLLARVKKIAPGIQFEIELITDKTLNSDLGNRKVDLVVGLEANHDIPKELVKKKLLTESLLCLISINNQNIDENMSLATYIKQPHVVFTDHAGYYNSVIDQWLEQQQLNRQTSSRNMSYTAAARIVALSDAVITLPAKMAEFFAEILPLRVVMPPKNIPNIEITVIRHPLYSKDCSIDWLISEIEQIIQ